MVINFDNQFLILSSVKDEFGYVFYIGVSGMQLMDIITWEPKDTEMVMTLFENYDYPQGIKVIDEWIDLTGYRMFIIYETEGEKIYAPSIPPLIGLCRFETVPVMKANIYTEMAQENAEKTEKRKYGAEH